jgi:enterochelin esterase-like enzyme
MRRLPLLFVLAIAALAQQSAPQAGSPPRRAPQPPPLISPEYLPEGRVTFRLRAPRAAEVTMRGEWALRQTIPMTKDAAGVWSATVGPLPPEVYAYSFVIDGVAIADPSNKDVKFSARGPSESLISVPGPAPQLHEPRDVPHGGVQENWYQSKTAGELRHYFVYTPPGYDARAAYPVLVLLHGAGNAETNWRDIGRAHFIIDNLLAERKVKPMLLLMPFGHTVPQGAPNARENNALFEKELLTDILPSFESRYKVGPGGKNRAIAGLSMGGMQALAIGLRNPDRFGWTGVFSPIMERDFDQRYAGQLASAGDLNRKISLLWVGCGLQDQLFPGTEALHATLLKSGVKHEYHTGEGFHSWVVWRKHLAEFAQKLFR